MAFGRSLLRKENGLFYRQMAYLFASGAALPEVLTILHDESEDTKTAKMAESIRTRLSHGDSIAESLSNYPHIFNPTLVYLLSTHQENEKISEFLYQYADEIERMDGIKLRLLRALIYPANILMIALVIMVILMIFVVPVFQEMFQDSELPAPTRFVISLSMLVKSYWIVILAGIIAIFLIITKSKTILYNIGSIFPVIRTLLDDLSVYSFSKYLSILIPLNRPLPETIEHAARMVPHRAYAERIIRACPHIQNMDQFKEQARKNKFLPNLFCSTLAIGIRTQSLEKLLAEMARFYEIRTAQRIEIASNFLEVFTIILIGIIVGGMVIALYLPIFSMAGAIG